MTVETATYINGLNATYPAASDPKSEGDDHLRLIKSTVKATFPNVTGAVTATHTELSHVAGVTSAIQTQIDTKAPTASPTFTGTPAAPTAAAGTNTTQIATTAHVAASIFAASGITAVLPGQTGNAGKFLGTDGTSANWVSNPFDTALALLGNTRNQFFSASGTFVVPSGVTSIRAYAFGPGGNGAAGVASTAGGGGGGGGGCAYGDIAVTPGDSWTVTVSGTTGGLSLGGTGYLTGSKGGNASGATGGTGGTATKNVSVTNGGAFAGGAGATSGADTTGGGGGASGRRRACCICRRLGLRRRGRRLGRRRRRGQHRFPGGRRRRRGWCRCHKHRGGRGQREHRPWPAQPFH